MNRTAEIERLLAVSLRTVLRESGLAYEGLQELRLRAERPLFVRYAGEERLLTAHGVPYVVTAADIKETLAYVSNYSLYAYEEEIRQGFLTVAGGHRVGLAGRVIVEDGRLKNMKHISFLNIRLAHEKKGCANRVLPYLLDGEDAASMRPLPTLIISPPGCGKTTLLRDLIRMISEGDDRRRGCAVGVVDERSELAACWQGKPQNDLGSRTDVLDCCPKAIGMLLLLRSMAPQVIAVDEIGLPEDVHALRYAFGCGCQLLATVHGSSLKEILQKPVLSELLREGLFARRIVLSGRAGVGTVEGIYDAEGKCLTACVEKNGTGVAAKPVL